MMKLTNRIATLLLMLFASTTYAAVDPAAVAAWSTIARRAIVPPGPNGAFGSENFGNKFPGEAAVYMGIVHAAIYDAAVAIDGGYRPYASNVSAHAGASADAAIATAAHHVLIGLQPALGLNAAQQAILADAYASSLAAIADGAAKTDGIAAGEEVANAILALRVDDGRERNPQLADLSPPAAGPGVWSAGSAPALGLRLPGMRPIVLTVASQFRPDGPNALTSTDYASDFAEVKSLGRADSTSRAAEQTTSALFWTDHDIRQWNDALLRLAAERGLDGVRTARLLAMAHAAGGDAMIACFDAKYTYWFWRPFQAIAQAGVDGNESTSPDAEWKPLRTTPNFPEYPSAHACHSTAVVEALDAFFGTDRIRMRLDSRVTGTTRDYERLHDAIRDIDWARVLAGFHFRNSDQEGSNLGRKVGRYVTANAFQPVPSPRAAVNTAGPQSSATITASFADSCRDFAAHSSKDISHVEVHYVSGRVTKDETINSPDYTIDGGPDDSIDFAIVKSGRTSEEFDCAQNNSAPVAQLEIRTPENCFAFFAGGLICDQSATRSVWTGTSAIPDNGGSESGLFHWGCGSLCSFAVGFRGINSSDADSDITSWSLAFGDGTSANGLWSSAPPVDVVHDYSRDAAGNYCVDNVCEITLTVTDSAAQSHSSAMRMVFVDQTPD